jgi:hypothetical protein
MSWVDEFTNSQKDEEAKKAAFLDMAKGMIALKTYSYEMAAYFKLIGATSEEASLMTECIMCSASDVQPEAYHYLDLVQFWVEQSYEATSKKGRKLWGGK